MRAALSVLILMFAFTTVEAQQTNFSFQKLELKDGLHDGTVRCIGEDRFGYMWIGTVGALNRFDGKNVVYFTNIPGDSASPYSSQPRSICSDFNKRLWIGYETGLVEYDFHHGNFRRIRGLEGLFIRDIVSFNDSVLFLATQKGLVRFNKNSGAIFNYAKSEHPLHVALFENAINRAKYKDQLLYLTTNKGLVILNTVTDEAKLVDIPFLGNNMTYALNVDKDHNVWIGTFGVSHLIKLHSDLTSMDIYDQYLLTLYITQALNIMDIIIDHHGTIWVATTVDGLLQYMPQSNKFIKHLHDPNIPSSPSGNNYRAIFQDDRGIIWLGCDFNGVNFFKPDRFSFKTILPFPDKLDERARGVGRAVTEDKQGNIWMGNHDGVSMVNATTNSYTWWRNENPKSPQLYNSVVRSIHCDNENNIWIGTSDGVNRYNNTSHKMEFIPTSDLPGSFYNSITQDREGNIWFCTNDTAGVYWYDIKNKTYHNISQHPQLKKYHRFAAASYVLEDSKHRLWISFSRRGIVMFDKINKQLKHYETDGLSNKNILGNQVVDIKEDKSGMIWASTFNGITGIDPERDSFINFAVQNGLPGNWVAPIAIDDENRVWAGVNGGLTMIHPNRRQVTIFTLDDGLPSVGFPEHAGIKTANGDIILPTYKGYIRFTPTKYSESNYQLNFYLSNYTVFGNQFLIEPDTTGQQKIELKAADNSFTFNLIALNYTKPKQTWYAYQLKGFDHEWHYTKDPKAVYTNIPGGTYQFLYKASTHNSNWEKIEAKTMTVQLASHFYRTFWFWFLMFLLVAGGFFALYRYRTEQQKQLFHLKSVTQLLEKEKATVMYESLKQHLNPHFLFNSLTSLRSLIKTDSITAAKFLDGLSKVYRYILKSGGQDLVLLHDELEFVTTFTELQKVRFGEGFIVRTNVSAEAQQKHIAPVVLQNLVENAIKHNTTSTDSPLVIEIFDVENCLLVRNNLQRYKSVETSNKRGLASLKNLYGFFTDEPVVIEEDDEYYTVKIPLL